MLRNVICGAAVGLGASLALQGCGGGSAVTSSTTTTTTTATTTATVTVTKTPPIGPTGLYWCDDLATFYKTTYTDGVATASGQCLPSETPGAYYTKPGEKDIDGKSDKVWSCFSTHFKQQLWTDAKAKAQGFEGACLFYDYNSTTKPEEIDDCSTRLTHHPSVCAPGPEEFWGACWSSHSENWRCIPIGDATIPGDAKGDCKANVLLEPAPSNTPTKYFYDGVCRFGAAATKLYKCDTVPDYASKSGGTCGKEVDPTADKACFSLKSGVQWQCIDAKKPFSGACDWTLLPDGSKDFYQGSCVFPNSKLYKSAVDAHNLTIAASLIV